MVAYENVRRAEPWRQTARHNEAMLSTFAVDGGAGPAAGWADGEGPDLLLVHGGPGLSDYMSLLAGETVGWRSVGYQQRGLARSTTEPPFTVEQHVADALAVLSAQAIGPAVVLGHSWGGHLALQIALADPGRVRGVVVVDGLGSVEDGGVTRLGAELRRRLPADKAAACARLDECLASEEANDDVALASLRLVWPSYFADPTTAPAPPPDLAMSLACTVGTTISAMSEIAGKGFSERLKELDLPVVVIVGARSPMPVDAGETTARLCGGQLRVVAGGGHLPWYEEPGCVQEALSVFS
jgi:pimeloyl-ACP methyl ester carboxylesterase